MLKFIKKLFNIGKKEDNVEDVKSEKVNVEYFTKKKFIKLLKIEMQSIRDYINSLENADSIKQDIVNELGYDLDNCLYYQILKVRLPAFQGFGSSGTIPESINYTLANVELGTKFIINVSEFSNNTTLVEIFLADSVEAVNMTKQFITGAMSIDKFDDYQFVRAKFKQG